MIKGVFVHKSQKQGKNRVKRGKNMKGPDISLEISLKEYGIAWEIGEKETKFWYGITHNGESYIRFDWGILENNIDLRKEYDWADFDSVARFIGCPMDDGSEEYSIGVGFHSEDCWENLSLVRQVAALIDFYGYMNIFGESINKDVDFVEVVREE